MTKILAVDDSVSIRQMVSHTLRDAGYDVETANDGRDALSKVTTSKFDVVISDVNMPNMGGFELVKALREKPQYKFIPILMLTTETSTDKKQQGKSAGATGWLVKPFNPDTLLKTLKRVI
ncbi:response regulator [Vibrio europaeus]|jgi:two-component system chemotaxis response regulator CheY|uniref:Chemotaxis regulator n=3 Tax=Vibrio oreintalis group TaxID=1891919 RepID=F9T970_9VIBR|nr:MULTISPECIES: response regulator [Vibrio oreintalis group]AIW15501.1 histidine kinase [Vibrio tubiashii ATCC 19109]EGU51518.1 chemotaxis regulator [Vibrio tubiashii ATCC 19109]EIF03707.1 chemotaxis protein CheY [Vibrio tubiashii NCIMB 1337 = ATCC 19106]MCG9576972.1 response regulator [Vibrio tubiashii]MCG9579955.1 response regulator [Vibrio tubiashii]|tara:strand:+ start:284 stop:643 length:360 start_codon:yes stop_codon:yes gene_type:complete